jgi:hypothetical protein
MQIRFACGFDLQSRAGFWKNDVLLIIQQLLFEIFWELLAYHHPTPQRQPILRINRMAHPLLALKQL